MITNCKICEQFVIFFLSRPNCKFCVVGLWALTVDFLTVKCISYPNLNQFSVKYKRGKNLFSPRVCFYEERGTSIGYFVRTFHTILLMHMFISYIHRYVEEDLEKRKAFLLEVKLPYDLVCPPVVGRSLGLSVFHNFLLVTTSLKGEKLHFLAPIGALFFIFIIVGSRHYKLKQASL